MTTCLHYPKSITQVRSGSSTKDERAVANRRTNNMKKNKTGSRFWTLLLRTEPRGFFLEPIWFPQLGGGGREVLEGGSDFFFFFHTLLYTPCCIDSDTSMRYCIDTAVSASIEAPAERVKYAARCHGAVLVPCARYTHPCQLLNTHR